VVVGILVFFCFLLEWIRVFFDFYSNGFEYSFSFYSNLGGFFESFELGGFVLYKFLVGFVQFGLFCTNCLVGFVQLGWGCTIWVVGAVPWGLVGFAYFCNCLINNESMAITRRDALREMEVKEDAFGREVPFALEFYTKDGEVRYYPRCRMVGTRKGVNQTTARVRNIQELDALGAPSGRPTMISIDLMRSFNGEQVVL